jgi:hypothetical protein
MKLPQKRSLILTGALALAFLITVQLNQTRILAQFAGDSPAPVFLPLVFRNYDPGAQAAQVDPIWRWGDINLAPGSKGILVTDLDGDGKNEVLTAHSKLLIALRATGQYRFTQTWAIPMGVSWGVADIAGKGANQVWMVYQDGQVLAYLPYTQLPLSAHSLALPSGAAVKQALVTDLIGDAEQELLVLINDGDLIAYSIPELDQVWSYHVSGAGSSDGGPTLIAAQVDDDPAQEIIVSSGSIVDPQLNVEQWRRDDGFGTVIRAGDIDSDGRGEIVGLIKTPGCTGCINHLTVFDADLRAIKWQMDWSETDTIELADVAGDTTPEILRGGYYDGSVEFYDAATQRLLWAMEYHGSGISGMGVGDADNDGDLWSRSLVSEPDQSTHLRFCLP